MGIDSYLEKYNEELTGWYLNKAKIVCDAGKGILPPVSTKKTMWDLEAEVAKLNLCRREQVVEALEAISKQAGIETLVSALEYALFKHRTLKSMLSPDVKELYRHIIENYFMEVNKDVKF